MKRKEKILNTVLFTIIAIAVIILIWATMPSKAQTIEAVQRQLIKVYETQIPYYEYLSDGGRLYVRICLWIMCMSMAMTVMPLMTFSGSLLRMT